jgi:hypothetical protein
MEDKNTKFRKGFNGPYRLMLILLCFIGVIVIMGIYVMVNPTTSMFSDQEPEEIIVAVPQEDDYDKIENGIHVRTGLIDAPGLMETVTNCTNCHSAKLVTQNRMSAERWKATIRWMQETQNLWDLGKNEDVIINYLVENYPPKTSRRREILSEIEWYVLEQ